MVDRNRNSPPPKKRKLSVISDCDIKDNGNATSNNTSNSNNHRSFTNTNKLSYLGASTLLGDDQEIFDIMSIRNEIHDLRITEDGQIRLLTLYHTNVKQYALGCNNVY